MPDRNSSVPTPRRSPRFLPQQNHDTPDPKSSKRSVSAEKSKNCAVGPKRSAGLNSLRRSPRLNNEPGDKKLKGTRVKGGEAETKSNRIVSVVEGSGGGRRRRNERNRKRVKVETQENRVVSDEGGAKKRGNGKRVEVKTDDNHVVLDEGLGGGRNKRGNSKKRKRGSEEIGKGWTKEQESALQKAYLTVKPTPHFWKNISKMVPGKSKQDCFDRIHSDYPTPPQTQTQTRSRAKTWNSSPIHQFSISPSNLLKPTDKTVRRRPTVLKPKNIITQKFVEKQLQRHLEVDLDCDGVDLFSVLEPNVDFPISKALPTPKRQKKNKDIMEDWTDVSPPVLKQLKNRVMHERYVNQLLCRDSRRRADTTKIIGKGTSFQKRDVVKDAKAALLSEARNAINRFQKSQANLVDNTCSTDEDNDDDIEFEDESQ